MYKTGRTNHDFQIAFFLLGKSHTPDAAYGVACDLLDDRRRALAQARVSEKRARAKRMAAEDALKRAPGAADRLMIEADLEELANGEADMKWLVVQAEREEAFIKTCIERIQPLRKYGHLPDHEAFEAAQRDEWRLELIHRAENYITSQGFVPHDEIATMRSHPDWEAQIFPHINMILEAKDKDELGKLLVKRPEHAALIAAARAELAN